MITIYALQSSTEFWFNGLIEDLKQTYTVISRGELQDIDDWHEDSLLLTCWERTDTPQLIERIRNSHDGRMASIHIIVVGEDDLEPLLRHHLAAVALLGPGTFYRQLAERAAPAIAQLAQEIGAIARRGRSSISLTMARQYLAGVPLLRGLLSEHTERDIVGPICLLHADPQTQESHWEMLGTAILAERESATSYDQRSALDWAQKLHAARPKDPREPALTSRKSSPHKADAGRWLLVDDNATLWAPALSMSFPALEPLVIPSNVGQEELVNALATTLLERTLCRNVDGILLGVRLAHSDRSDTYLEATASVTSQTIAKQYSGIQLLGKFREQDVATPILVLTGSRNAFVEQAITAHGGTYLLKPANPENAKETLKALRDCARLARFRGQLQRRELMFITRKRLSLSPDVGRWANYLEPLRHALALWALCSRSENSSCEPLRQGTLLSFGLVAEELLTWMAHRDAVTLGNSPKYRLSARASKEDKELFNLLLGTGGGAERHTVMWYRNQAAHPNREINFKSDDAVIGCATKLLRALQKPLHALDIQPI